MKRGAVIYDAEHGHVCKCSELAPLTDANGEPVAPNYRHTVHVALDVEPTDSGSWLYVCGRCGATAWSGC